MVSELLARLGRLRSLDDVVDFFGALRALLSPIVDGKLVPSVAPSR